jgi:nucleotide-binding universal stress UspA family protein
MFKHILLPTDGSELSEKAIREGIHLAKELGAKFTGVCIIPEQHPFFYETEIPAEALKQIAKQSKEASETYLSVIQKKAEEAGVECEVVCKVTDYIYEAIIRVAEQKGCDLIMMASHGRRGFQAFGSSLF